MPNIVFNGQKHFIPGVYDKTIVRSSLPGPLPQFHTPLALSRAWQGHPYNADSLKLAGEPPFTPFLVAGTAGTVAEYYGFNSDLHRSMVWAKRHGLPLVYACSLSPLTRASVLVTSLGPVSEFTVYPKSFGAPPGWTKLGWVGGSGTLTIVPVKSFAMVATTLLAADTRIYVQGNNTWLVEGLEITLGDNSIAPVTRTIVQTGNDIAADGRIEYWIEVDAPVGFGFSTASYALVLVYNETGKTVEAGIATGQAFLDFLSQDPAANQLLVAQKDVGFSDVLPIDIPTPTALNKITAWGAVANGTSPAPTSADVDAYISLMNGGQFDAFAVREQAIPQAYYLGVGDSDSHKSMRDYSTAERVRGFPISVTSGVQWGDTSLVALDDTAPPFRSAALDSENVMLLAGGLDREAAYLSIAAATWARRVAAGPGHNLTNDELIFSEREKSWNQIENGELATLLKKGVSTYKLSFAQTIRYRLAQGISTLQNNQGLIWNENDATTWSTMQRDLADFVNAVIKRDFEESLIGADQVDPNAIAAIMSRRAEKSLLKQSFIKTFTITSIALNSGANGYDVKWSVTLPDTNDFMTVETTILIGE
tara:strand:- start:15834 stop:17612 length:1779 start_codon:yes stop_codon:yes gene_type:complete